VARGLLALLSGLAREEAVAGREKGFSLIELVVAMTVTLIITGAVFQLVTAGKSAFRREPELSDRQQNIRSAMDIISQDVYRAGYGVPQFAQVFTDALNGAGPMGAGGTASDIIEIFMASECPPLTVCPVTGQAGKSVTTRELLSSCYRLPSLVILGDSKTWGVRWAEAPGSASSTTKCDDTPPGTKGGHVVFPPGQAPLVNPTGGFGGWQPTYMLVGQAVRYRINVGADGVHNLERSAFGGQNDLNGNSTWEIIGRGVEDLQVQYENGLVSGGSAWHDTPGTIACGGTCANPTAADYNTLVRRVRIRLSARATGGGRFQGESTSAVGTAIRGQLVNEIAPRAAQATLATANGDM
jgi:prepilin-type N-terminal cleavage/methylation domain-containing protein